MKIDIWYFYNDYLSPNWRTPVSQAFNIALPRLRNYFGTSWDFQFMREFRTTVRYDTAIMPNKCIQAVTELANSDPAFKAEYNSCELPLFIFADSTDAFIFDYMSPVWSSDSAFLHEIEGQVIIEHEIGHTFGLPDHVKPWAKPYYEYCMMGNPYVGSIQLCPECKPKFILSNYKKHPYSDVVNNVSDELPIIPQEPPEEPALPEPGAQDPSGPEFIGTAGVGYAYWAGGVPQRIDRYNTWVSDREITCSLQVANHELSTRSINIIIEFAGQRSNTLQIPPGQNRETVFILEPLAVGTYDFSLKMFESGNLFGSETMRVNVIQSEPPIVPVYQVTQTVYGPGGRQEKFFDTKVVAGALTVVGVGLMVASRKRR